MFLPLKVKSELPDFEVFGIFAWVFLKICLSFSIPWVYFPWVFSKNGQKKACVHRGTLSNPFSLKRLIFWYSSFLHENCNPLQTIFFDHKTSLLLLWKKELENWQDRNVLRTASIENEMSKVRNCGTLCGAPSSRILMRGRALKSNPFIMLPLKSKL